MPLIVILTKGQKNAILYISKNKSPNLANISPKHMKHLYIRPLLTTRTRARMSRFVAFAAMTSMVFLSMPFSPASAAGLTTTRMYLSRQQAGLATGVGFDLFFTPATALTGTTNKVILTFPNDAANNTKWCKTNAGTLTITAETEPATTTQVTAESATNIIGSVTGACTQTPDTFTLSAVGALQAGTKYGVRITGNSSAIGTGDAANNIKIAVKTQQVSTDTDSFTIATSLVAADQYTVSANIDPTLTVVLSATTLNLGTLTSASVFYQGVTSTVTTNAKNGYVSLVSYSAALSNGVDTITDAGGTATAGTSGFGASTSKASQTIGTSTASPACSTTQQSSAGPYVATTLTTGFKQFSSAAGTASADATTLCFLAAISGTQAPGAYSTTVTLVTTAKF